MKKKIVLGCFALMLAFSSAATLPQTVRAEEVSSEQEEAETEEETEELQEEAEAEEEAEEQNKDSVIYRIKIFLNDNFFYSNATEQNSFSDIEKAELPEQEEEPEEEEVPEYHVIKNFQLVYQEPELPTGCEVTALTMAINYNGDDVETTTLARDYLPKLSSIGTYRKDGKTYGADMYNNFIGNPFSHGRVCGPGAIETAANDYFEDVESALSATDITGATCEEMYEYVSKDIPVVVWVTIGMKERDPVQGWYTENEVYVDWAREDHCAVLIGYSKEKVIIADPISGMVHYDRDKFEEVMESRGYKCVIINPLPKLEPKKFNVDVK